MKFSLSLIVAILSLCLLAEAAEMVVRGSDYDEGRSVSYVSRKDMPYKMREAYERDKADVERIFSQALYQGTVEAVQNAISNLGYYKNYDSTSVRFDYNFVDHPSPSAMIAAANYFNENGYTIQVCLDEDSFNGLACSENDIKALSEAKLIDLNNLLYESDIRGRFDIVEFLLYCGADINYRVDAEFEYTVLGRAILNEERCDFNCVEGFVYQNASLDKVGPNGGYIYVALKAHREDVARLLIENHAAEPFIWHHISESKMYGLFALALKAGYEISIMQRKLVIAKLLEQKMFADILSFLDLDWDTVDKSGKARIIGLFARNKEDLLQSVQDESTRQTIETIYQKLAEIM